MYCSSLGQLLPHRQLQVQMQASSHKEVRRVQRQHSQVFRTKLNLLHRGNAS